MVNLGEENGLLLLVVPDTLMLSGLCSGHHEKDRAAVRIPIDLGFANVEEALFTPRVLHLSISLLLQAVS